MCGIVASFSRRHCEQLTEAITYRGDRSRIRAIGGAYVGHVRLPIVGLSEEWDQPVQHEGHVVAFAGEILNFRDFTPDAECDRDLVVTSWIDRGLRFFDQFEGFWALVSADRMGRIHAITDYLCQKPLYWRNDQYATAVCSEPWPLAKLGPTWADEIYLSAVQKWGYCPEGHRTPWNEVQKMRPAEWRIINESGQTSAETIGSLVPFPRVSSPSDLREAIDNAVRLRVESSDVPVACLVSGGLDSAITYTLAKEYGSVRPYHVSNGENAEAHRVIGTAAPRTLAPTRTYQPREILEYMQEPVDLGSVGPQIDLSRAVGGSDRVCLTGDGADELFGGYSRASRYDSQSSDVWHELVGYHLPRLDRVMSRNKVEQRSPFLARPVVEMALGLPQEQRTNKKILRDLFRDILPPGTADVPKKALRTPEIERDREGNSIRLVSEFRRMAWPE